MLNGSCRCRGVGASHTPPPLPTMSTSSSSSPSCSSSQLKRSGTGTGTTCARNIKSSEVETSGAHGSSPSSSITGTATTRASAKKKDKEYLCPRCGGDVRLPPLPKIQRSASSENEPKTKSITEIGFHSSEPFVVCALGCTSSRYHVSILIKTNSFSCSVKLCHPYHLFTFGFVTSSHALECPQAAKFIAVSSYPLSHRQIILVHKMG